MSTIKTDDGDSGIVGIVVGTVSENEVRGMFCNNCKTRESDALCMYCNVGYCGSCISGHLEIKHAVFCDVDEEAELLK